MFAHRLVYDFASVRYEAKRQEIEAWLMRMEGRSERMGNAEAQADVLDFSVLDTQQKEQKVCQAKRSIYGERFYALWTWIFFSLLAVHLKFMFILLLMPYEILMTSDVSFLPIILFVL